MQEGIAHRVVEFDCRIKFPIGSLTFTGKHLVAEIELITETDRFPSLEAPNMRGRLPAELSNAEKLVITIHRPFIRDDETQLEMSYDL